MKRVEALIGDKLYRQYLQKNKEAEEGVSSCHHDFRHHLDVARLTYILVLEDNDLHYFIKDCALSGRLAAKEVIYAAGLTHDIAKWKEYKYGVDHAAFGARMAREFLPQALFTPNEVDIICRAIYEHRNISQDMSFLGERLHRADNLSRTCQECDYRGQCPKIKKKEISVTSFEY